MTMEGIIDEKIIGINSQLRNNRGRRPGRSRKAALMRRMRSLS